MPSPIDEFGEAVDGLWDEKGGMDLGREGSWHSLFYCSGGCTEPVLPDPRVIDVQPQCDKVRSRQDLSKVLPAFNK